MAATSGMRSTRRNVSLLHLLVCCFAVGIGEALRTELKVLINEPTEWEEGATRGAVACSGLCTAASFVLGSFPAGALGAGEVVRDLD